MPIQINNDLKPKENSLVVCAGTITCNTVDSMGSGFVLFKNIFDQNIHHEEKSGGWKEERVASKQMLPKAGNFRFVAS